MARASFPRQSLRSVIGRRNSRGPEREDNINLELQKIIDEKTDPWGIKVSAVEVKELELPEGMKRAMARQAEAERERRAKIISAEGEAQAAERLSEAARIMGVSPVTLQLRYLQTMREIASEKNAMTLFPFSFEIMKAFLARTGQDSKEA